jgi:hypothetical protein
MKKSKTHSKLWILLVLLVSFVAGCGSNDRQDQTPAKAITAFSLGASTGTVDETAKTIEVTLPYGTPVTAAVATFTTTGASTRVGDTVQTSGTTPNNFTGPVLYTEMASDGTAAQYTVTATVAPITGKAVTAFTLGGVAGTVDETAKTISVTLPNGTDLTGLVATFSTTGSGVKAAGADQLSGTTANNFTSPVSYLVTAADGSTSTYTVTVIAAASDAKAMTSFAIAGAAGVIDETQNTIAVTLPFGTSLSALVASFSATGAGVKVGGVLQKSGTTTNNFSAPVTYTISAADGSTADYAVTVTAAGNSAKALSAYSLARVTGTIDESAKTIELTMPSGTDLSALIASFTTTGASVKVGSAVQKSGTTANSFANPVTYTVTAADGSTTSYQVRVSVAANSAKAITVFSFPGATGTINESAKTIAVTEPSGTSVTGLIATFTRTGTSVKVGTAIQTSAITANNFTNPVTYNVTAADGSTAAYIVTVTLAAPKGPAPVLLGTAGNFVVLAKTKVSTVPASVITGDVGVSPAATTFLTGFSLTMVGTTSALATQVIGNLYGADMTAPTSTKLTTAILDMATAYTDAAGRPTPNFTNQGAGEIGGQTLVPGLYTWTSGVTVSSDVTISGGSNDVWIFQIPGNLTVSPAKHVTLLGGAKAKNIFWQVAGAANIGTTAHFEGIILSQTSITLGTGASMNGRALAQSAVILDSNALTKPN